MLASVLHPYKDGRGRYYPSILPFLVRRFGKDQEVEVVRSNLVRARQKQVGEEWDASEGLEQLLLSNGKQEDEDERKEEEDEVMPKELAVGEKQKKKERVAASGWGDVKVVPEEKMDVDEPVNGFAVTVETREEEEEEVLAPRQTRAGAALKRKSETFAEVEEVKKPAKRVDTKAVVEKNENKVEIVEKAVVEEKKEEGDDGSDSDDEGSVQIDMSLDDSEDEGGEEEDEE